MDSYCRLCPPLITTLLVGVEWKNVLQHGDVLSSTYNRNGAKEKRGAIIQDRQRVELTDY
ncbi:hypothetical protein N7534_005163 [Penicillium rubens]|nr:hypothetical protein N7534_005163 [Penicillium rubens]